MIVADLLEWEAECKTKEITIELVLFEEGRIRARLVVGDEEDSVYFFPSVSLITDSEYG